MDLSPGEKAVLGQIRVLYGEAAGDQLFRALIGQWPAAHYQAYNNSYEGLITKGYIKTTNGQAFKLTDMGMRALGLAPAPSPIAPPPKIDRRPVQATPIKPAKEVARSAISRLAEKLFGRS